MTVQDATQDEVVRQLVGVVKRFDRFLHDHDLTRQYAEGQSLCDDAVRVVGMVEFRIGEGV